MRGLLLALPIVVDKVAPTESPADAGAFRLLLALSHCVHRSLSLTQCGELSHHLEVLHAVGFRRYAFVVGHIEHDVKCIG